MWRSVGNFISMENMCECRKLRLYIGSFQKYFGAQGGGCTTCMCQSLKSLGLFYDVSYNYNVVFIKS